MNAHGSTTDAGQLSARRVAVFVTALVLVGLLGTGLAVGGAAADDIERDGSDLVVNVSTIDDPDTLSLEVTDPADTALRYTENATGAEDTVAIDLRDPAEGDPRAVDLTNATATIDVEHEEDGNTTTTTLAEPAGVPLHTVTFAADKPAWIDSGGEDAETQLRVPLDLDNSVGLADGAEVSIDVGGNDTVRATVTEGGTQLVVFQPLLLDEAPGAESLTVQVTSDLGPVASEAVHPALRSTADGAALWHPLFASDESYAVNVYDPSAETDARYTETAAETNAGFLDVSPVTGDQIAGTVTAADGNLLVNATESDPLRYDGLPKIDGDIDGDTVVLDSSLSGLAVEAVLVETADDVEYVEVDATVDDGGELPLDDVAVAGGETIVALTAAGEIAIPIEETTADADGAGIVDTLSPVFVFLLPFVFGLLPGTLFGARTDDSPDLVQTALVCVIGVSLAGITAIIAWFAFASEPIGLSTIHLIGLGGIALGTVVGGVTHQWLGAKGSATGERPFAANVRVTDGSELIRGDITIHYRVPGGREQTPKTVRGGTAQIQLPSNETWEVYARHAGSQSTIETVTPSDSSVTLSIPLKTTITVVDATTEEPIDGVTASTEAGVVGTTGRDGAVTIDPETAPTNGGVDVTLSHDRYTDATQHVRFQQGETRRVTLERRTGQLAITTRVGNTPTGPVPIRVIPDDEFLTAQLSAKTVTTDEDGTLEPKALPIGTYRVESSLPDAAGVFTQTEQTISVDEAGTTTVRLDLQFTWQPDAARRDRVEQLRTELRAVADGGGRDSSIPRYYASVVESLLDAAATMPDAGQEFVGREIRPDTAMDAILDAAERATDAISEAMTTKRNVDLFAACADMPDPQITWDRPVDRRELLDRLEAESTVQRREVKQRYEAVDSIIEAKRGELSEIAPAREMQKRAWELTQNADRGPAAVATGYTSLLLLDAVEALFEHDALRERLTRTVF